MANEQNLRAPWKPGEPGNPNGYSKGRRTATKLRQALDLILEQPVPPTLLAPLPDEVLDTLPDSVTFAELIALRVVIVGATAPKIEQILNAATMIMTAQARLDISPDLVQRLPPVLLGTEERRLAVAEQLGLVKPKAKRKPRKKAAKKKRARKKAGAKRKRKPKKKGAKK